MLSNRKPIIEKYLHTFIKPLAHVNPNIITIIGSIPPLLFFVFVISGYYNLALAVFPFLLIDLLDGAVARVSGKVTAFGGFLDSTVDRISDFLLITSFGFGMIVRWEIVVIFLLAVFLVSYARSRGELASNKTVSFDLGLIERAERLMGVFICLLGYIFIPYVLLWSYNISELIFVFLIFLSFITFLQRIIWAYKKL